MIFEPIDDTKKGILDKYDNEEIIGYRKRKIKQDKEEKIYHTSIVYKYLAQTQEVYCKVLREMFEINGNRPMAKETPEERKQKRGRNTGAEKKNTRNRKNSEKYKNIRL